MTPLSRSDRLPFTTPHRRIPGVVGVGWALDAMVGTLLLPELRGRHLADRLEEEDDG
ncbi:MAG TPA: hypothetical protein VHG28_08185 [Longimicrobiaceae bacterium]|nr:hypothetical protein [Longimicrobiaceae bacterium]